MPLNATQLPTALASPPRKQPVSPPRNGLPFDPLTQSPDNVESATHNIQASIMKRVANRSAPRLKVNFFGTHSGAARSSSQYDSYVPDDYGRDTTPKDVEPSLDAPQGSQTGDLENGLLPVPALADKATGHTEDNVSGPDGSRTDTPDSESPTQISEQSQAEDLRGSPESIDAPSPTTFLFPRIRDPSEFRDLFNYPGGFKSMPTDQLYRSTALVANAMAVYQDEYLQLQKFLDGEVSVTKRKAADKTLTHAESNGTRSVGKEQSRESHELLEDLDHEAHVAKVKQQDKVQADAYFFPHNPKDSAVGNQKPVPQREGFGSGRLRSKPQPSLRALEAKDSTEGKRARKPPKVCEPPPEPARCSTRAVKTRTLDDELDIPAPSPSRQMKADTRKTSKGEWGSHPKKVSTLSHNAMDEGKLITPDASDTAGSAANSVPSVLPQAISPAVGQSQAESRQPPATVQGQKRKGTAAPSANQKRQQRAVPSPSSKRKNSQVNNPAPEVEQQPAFKRPRRGKATNAAVEGLEGPKDIAPKREEPVEPQAHPLSSPVRSPDGPWTAQIVGRHRAIFHSTRYDRPANPETQSSLPSAGPTMTTPPDVQPEVEATAVISDLSPQSSPPPSVDPSPGTSYELQPDAQAPPPPTVPVPKPNKNIIKIPYPANRVEWVRGRELERTGLATGEATTEALEEQQHLIVNTPQLGPAARPLPAVEPEAKAPRPKRKVRLGPYLRERPEWEGRFWLEPSGVTTSGV